LNHNYYIEELTTDRRGEVNIT